MNLMVMGSNPISGNQLSAIIRQEYVNFLFYLLYNPPLLRYTLPSIPKEKNRSCISFEEEVVSNSSYKFHFTEVNIALNIQIGLSSLLSVNKDFHGVILSVQSVIGKFFLFSNTHYPLFFQLRSK